MKRHLHKLMIFAVVLSGLTLVLAACGQGGEAAGESGANLELGQQLYQANCSSCHSTQAGTVLVGPSLAGLGERAGEIVPGLTAEEYILQSINEPGAYVNEGFQNLMPDSYNQILSEEEMDSLVAYLIMLD